MLTNKEGEQKKRLPIVVYDKTIVCKNCENIWAEWDNYAQQLLVATPLNGQPYYIGSKQICYVVHDYDYRKLKLFFISVLWRHPFLARISFQGFLLANLRI